MDWQTRVNDDGAQFEATLKDENDVVIDLTGIISVVLEVWGPRTASFTCTVTNATGGIVEVYPSFTESGAYRGRVVVTYGDSSIQSFPSGRDLDIVVRANN